MKQAAPENGGGFALGRFVRDFSGDFHTIKEARHGAQEPQAVPRPLVPKRQQGNGDDIRRAEQQKTGKTQLCKPFEEFHRSPPPIFL